MFFKENYSTPSARLAVKAAKAIAKNLENSGLDKSDLKSLNVVPLSAPLK